MNTMPNFFIVGAAKSGTSSLDQYLSQHPEIYMAPIKETHYFAVNQFPSCFKGPGDEALNKIMIRDEAQYSQLFANAAGEKAIGEASVFYLWSPDTAERIAQAVPDAKIIMILREPVSRAYSAYMHLIRDGRETLKFADALILEEERKQKDFEPIWWYKELSLYHKQVKQYLNVFGTQQVKILLYNELSTNPRSVLRDVFTFLGVRDDIAIDTYVHHNSSRIPKSGGIYTPVNNFIYSPHPLAKGIRSLVPLQLRILWASRIQKMLLQTTPINPQTHAQLKEYFAEDVGKLGDLLHRDLSNWHTARASVKK